MSIILSLLSMVLGWFGFGKKDERDEERKAGEQLGKAETENAALKQYVKTEAVARDATARVNDDPDSVLNDPNNRSRPAP